MKNRRCLTCPLRGKVSSGNIVRYGFYRTRSGKRRRFRCVECGKTFSLTRGTPYYRLQHRRATFDAVVALRVEGVSISATARVEGIAWNTVARWLERAAHVCRRFNRETIIGFAVEEFQADEVRTFVGSKKRPSWISRRTLSHARSTERLDEHLELLRCYYNFVRPHGTLNFGREIRTPAMQASLTTRRLTFRDIFLATTIPLWSRIEVFLLSRARNPVSSAPGPLPAAA